MDAKTRDHKVISSDRVEGSAVYNARGDKLGSIDALMIDKRSDLPQPHEWPGSGGSCEASGAQQARQDAQIEATIESPLGLTEVAMGVLD